MIFLISLFFVLITCKFVLENIKTSLKSLREPWLFSSSNFIFKIKVSISSFNLLQKKLCLKLKHLLIKSINYNWNNTEIFLTNLTQEEHILQRKENNKKLRPDILERGLKKKVK